jgi:hypothetical protein
MWANVCSEVLATDKRQVPHVPQETCTHSRSPQYDQEQRRHGSTTLPATFATGLSATNLGVAAINQREKEQKFELEGAQNARPKQSNQSTTNRKLQSIAILHAIALTCRL